MRSVGGGSLQTLLHEQARAGAVGESQSRAVERSLGKALQRQCKASPCLSIGTVRACIASHKIERKKRKEKNNKAPLSLFFFSEIFKMHHVTEANQTIVRTLAAAGIRHEDIATKLGISQDTLVRKYRVELDDGRIDATSEMATSLFNAGKNGNIPAAIFWLKSRAGWSDRSQIELTGENGGPIKVDTTVFNELITNLETRRQLKANE